MLRERLPCVEAESHDTNTMEDPPDQEDDSYGTSDLDAEWSYPEIAAGLGHQHAYSSKVELVDPALWAS